MNDAGQHAAFRREKHQFFSSLNSLTNRNDAFLSSEQRAKNIDYAFLLRHQALLETEFKDLFAVLTKDAAQREDFWFYSYYCACLLEQFHQGYCQPEKVADYQSIKQEIKRRIQGDWVESPASEKTFIQFLYHSFSGQLTRLMSMPFHLSRIRDEVVYANLCRIHWVFNRLTLVQGLKTANAAHWIEQLDLFLGTHTDVDQLIATIQAPIGMVNYLSVGFFLTRFVIDAGLLIKHTFFPSELEKSMERGCEINKLSSLPASYENKKAYLGTYLLVDAQLYYLSKNGVAEQLTLDTEPLVSLLANQDSIYCGAKEIETLISNPTGHQPEKTTAYERFLHELYKRHCNFANDLVWATVNFLTNFNSISGISDPVAGYLIATFLVFDVAMMSYKKQLAWKEYQEKKEAYQAQQNHYQDPLQATHLSDAERRMHLDLLKKQLDELETNWKAQNETFNFLIAAAALLMSTFTVSLLLSNPVLITASFFVCTVGVAMYLSYNEYHRYQQARFRQDQAEQAGQDFILTLAKNALLPMVMFATYTVCWPAGFALSMALMGAGLAQAYDQSQKKAVVQRQPVDESQAEDAGVDSPTP